MPIDRDDAVIGENPQGVKGARVVYTALQYHIARPIGSFV